MKLTSALVVVICFMCVAMSPAYAAQTIQKFSSKEQLCDYLKSKKESAEQTMRNGYSASQYDQLEQQRKFWKKQYVDRCF
jgi:hypothetical protein